MARMGGVKAPRLNKLLSLYSAARLKMSSSNTVFCPLPERTDDGDTRGFSADPASSHLHQQPLCCVVKATRLVPDVHDLSSR